MTDLIIAGGMLVDPGSGRHGQFDLAVANGRIEEVATELPRHRTRRVLEAGGRYVLPGLVDTHVHVGSEPVGYRMLLQAGVTCALDLAAKPERFLPGLRDSGRGLSMGFLFPLIPGDTVTDREPGEDELAVAVDHALDHGALGVKILGGHYPLTPSATARAIRIAHQKHCWCGVHAGTTSSGSNIDGLEELTGLAEGLPVHIAHVNSYCRGQSTGDPLLEASRALKALAGAPNVRSESYLARINGTSAHMVDGVPKSETTKTCLQMGGFPATETGMADAIASGWAQVNWAREDGVVLLSPEEGTPKFLQRAGPIRVSFPVNHPAAAIALATAKQAGEFVVTALSTDGGSIPRNVTLEKGFALVRFGALSLEEFVVKACLNPARMLGLGGRGHLAAGAAADVIVVNPLSTRVETVIAGGEVLMHDGDVSGGAGRLITTARGRDWAAGQGLQTERCEPDWLG